MVSTTRRKTGIVETGKRGGKAGDVLEVSADALPEDEPIVGAQGISGQIRLEQTGITGERPPRIGEVYPGKANLSVMPFAVLLPALGDLRRLNALKQEFSERIELLSEHDPNIDEASAKRRSSEMSMLTQVLTWLTVGENKGIRD